MPPNFAALDYTIDHNHHHHHHQQHQDHHQLMRSHIDETSSAVDQNDDRLMVNYLMNMNNNNNPHQQSQQLSFADVMQFADFGPKLGLNQTKIPEEEEDHDQTGNNMVDPVYFLKFPVLNDKNIMEDQNQSINDVVSLQPAGNDVVCQVKDKEIMREDQDHDNSSVQLQFLGEDVQKNPTSEPNINNKNKRKRPRTIKTSEEVESQRMTHIAVERNRRKQMNEHLRVLRSLMPGSYVQRVRHKITNHYLSFKFHEINEKKISKRK